MTDRVSVECVPVVVGIGTSPKSDDAILQILGGLDASLAVSVFIGRVGSSSQAISIEQNRILLEGQLRGQGWILKEICDEQPVEARAIYFIPEGASLTFTDGRVCCAEVVEEGQLSTVDQMFEAIADEFGELAVGIGLASEGTDGALGLKAISDAGGMTIAESSPVAAGQAGRLSVASLGAVDHVMNAAEIALELSRHVEHLARHHRVNAESELTREIIAAVPEIAAAIKKHTKHDFRHYKTSTLVRRVRRRLQVAKVSTISAYLEILDSSRDESFHLFRDLLISVTEFFRDTEAFELLANQVIPRLLDDYEKSPKADGEPVRVWVAGCATGEEAYSLAILFCEAMELRSRTIPIQIIATDLDDRALQIARHGAYPIGIQDQVSEQRLQRFFSKRANRYYVSRKVRDLIVFSTHNLISDPPFTRQDMISCRNLLIYLGPHLQKKLIPLFHYALNSEGCLFLGQSESMAAHKELFRPIDPQKSVFVRKAAATRKSLPRSLSSLTLTERSGETVSPPPDIDLHAYGQSIVLDEFSPQWVVADDNGEIHALSSDTSQYLKLGGGPFRNSVVQMVRSELRMGLRTAFSEAKRLRRRIVAENLFYSVEGGIQRVNITVQPMPDVGVEAGLHMIVFQAIGEPLSRENLVDEAATKANFGRDSAETLIDQLERELASTRIALERTVAEQEAANEELKVSNEELLSINEELRAANEALEVSKDVMQATNETLARVNTDQENLLRSTKIATIFLDREYRIRGFTPAASAIYGLLETDIGRPLSQLSANAKAMPPLPTKEDFQHSDNVIEHPVQLLDGRWFIRRVSAYKTSAQTPDGFVLTFNDVTDLYQSQSRMEMALIGGNMGAWDLDLANGVAWRSPLHDAIFGYATVEGDWTLDRFLSHVVEEDRDHVRSLFLGVDLLHSDWTFECRIRRADGQLRWIAPRGSTICDERGVPVRMYGTVADVTERRRDAERIRNSESYLRRLIDNMAAFLGVLDLDGTLLDANRAAIIAAGVERADVIGRKFWDCYWWSYDAAVAKQLKEAIYRARSGEVVRYDCNVRMAGGQIMTIDFMLAPAYDEEGTITHLIPSGVDITERLEAEQRFRALADNIAQFAWIADPNGDITWYNQRWFDYTGTTFEEMQGWGWIRVHHPDHIARVIEKIKNSFDTSCDWEDTFPLRRHDGVYRWFLSRMTPIRDESGAVIRWFGTNTDITDQKEAEERLTRRTDELELGIEVAGFAVAEIDYQQEMVTMTEGFARLYGLPLEPLKITRQELHALLHPDDREWVLKQIQDKFEMKSNHTLAFEHRIVRPDQSVRWLSVRKRYIVTPGLEDQSDVVTSLLAVHDITNQKVNESELEKARLLAEAANQSKSDFLANMSHEIRSPMTAILGFADLLKTDDEEEREKVETIRRNGKFLLELVNDILDLSKIEAGKVDVDLVTFSPIHLLEDVCSLMLVRAVESGLLMKTVYDGPIPNSMRSDPIRLRQILINLIGNAIKFTEEGSVTLKLAYDEERKQVRFEVIDTGIGISEANQRKLFQPFEQGDSSIVRQYGGSGLGLAISQRLAELLGGHIEVQSRFRVGSTFSLVLPGEEVEATQLVTNPADWKQQLSALVEAKSRGAALQETGRLDIRVLIVDDRRDIRFLTQHMVHILGGEVLLGENGVEAIEVIAREQREGRKVDIVLMDVQMPKMDGLTAVRKLRQMGFSAPVIALTANAMDADREACFAAGYTDYLSKPVDSQQLTEKLREYCSNLG